jgi:hypothetical protein
MNKKEQKDFHNRLLNVLDDVVYALYAVEQGKEIQPNIKYDLGKEITRLKGLLQD